MVVGPGSSRCNPVEESKFRRGSTEVLSVFQCLVLRECSRTLESLLLERKLSSGSFPDKRFCISPPGLERYLCLIGRLPKRKCMYQVSTKFFGCPLLRMELPMDL